MVEVLALSALHMCIRSLIDSFAILWTVAHLAPLSVGIFQARILKWIVTSSSRDLSDPGIERVSPASLALAD